MLKRQLTSLLVSCCPPPLFFLADKHTATLADVQEAFLDEGPSDQGLWTNESQWAESLTVMGRLYTAGGPAPTTHAPLGSGQALCRLPLGTSSWGLSCHGLSPLTSLSLERPRQARSSFVPVQSRLPAIPGVQVSYGCGTKRVPLIMLEVRSPKLDKKEGVGNTSLSPEALEANLFPELYLPKSLMPDAFPPAANPAMWDPASFLTEPRSRVRLPRLLRGHFCLHLGPYLGNPG